MTIILLRILFFCLVPLGVFFIFKGIQLARKAFSGAILLEIPYNQRTGQFSIPTSGAFTIWQKGRLQKRPRVTNIQPIIRHTVTQQEVPLYSVRSQVSSNNGSVGRVQIFSFDAQAGSYTLQLVESAGFDKPVDLSKYFIQVSERQPSYYIVFGVLLILLGAFTAMGGMGGMFAPR